ncbi:hypothetical protein GQ600_4000 [Phytophthora cactorum]|nr:hypothetical protein GQ600_4000 [Phytophthora cactorum]
MHVSDNGAVQQCSLPFCLSCLLKAKQQSGWEMAMRSLEASSASVGSSPPTPPPRVLSNANQRRDGRSYSAYTGNYARQRGEMTSTSIHSKDLYRSASEQTTAESYSTNNVTVQAWSPRSAGPKSTRGARFG